MTNLKTKIKFQIKTIYENVYRYRRRKHEIKKFEDPRRKEIYEKIELTKEQKDAIDKLYMENYGEKIPYTWHKHYTAFTGNFDVNYFTDLLFIPEFEYFINLNKEYAKVLEDKNFLPLIAKAANIKMPKTILSKTYGIYKDSDDNVINENMAIDLLNFKGELFEKQSVDSYGGKSCNLLNINNGVDLISKKSINDFLKSIGDNFVIQERLKCHSSISNIYPNSVNTFRVITYIWKNNIKVLPVVMRIGSGGNFIDNVTSGGMFIAIDDNGKLHKTAFNEFKTEFTEHPDTHIIFSGYQIENFESVIKSARKMHLLIPQIGCINWDFTIDENGEPVIIEANVCGGSIDMLQMTHGKGPFGEDTAEILRWIKFMKKANYTERRKHLFGNID